MKRVRILVVRAVVAALLLMALAGSLAYADDGDALGSGAPTVPNVIPEDPGIE
jgi:hypothetical protein